MITLYDALKETVETTVHKAYADLADYAKSDWAKPEAVFVRRKIYDTFADGWNAAEAEIERLRMEIKRLKSHKSMISQNSEVAVQVLPYQIADLRSPFSRHNPLDKEHLRTFWNAHQRQKWNDHF